MIDDFNKITDIREFAKFKIKSVRKLYLKFNDISEDEIYDLTFGDYLEKWIIVQEITNPTEKLNKLTKYVFHALLTKLRLSKNNFILKQTIDISDISEYELIHTEVDKNDVSILTHFIQELIDTNLVLLDSLDDKMEEQIIKLHLPLIKRKSYISKNGVIGDFLKITETKNNFEVVESVKKYFEYAPSNKLKIWINVNSKI
jgi:hypothetical protein